jgi:F-box and leucine-rich repeat protein GRR1
MRVNWTWFDVAHSSLWQRPVLNSVRRIAKVGRVLQSWSPLQDYPKAIRRINMSSLDKDRGSVSDEMLLAFKGCVNAERLTMGAPINVSSDALITLFQQMPKLVAVDMNGNHNVNDEAIMALAANCHDLQGLNISGCEEVGNKGLKEIAKNCAGLRRVGCIVV